MRVVAGALGGRRLQAPPGTDTRPTSDKVRQAVFNALESAGLVEGMSFLDLFAGSGAMGIEALSRGATSCTFVERDRAALSALRENVATLGLGEQARIVAGDVLAHLSPGAIPRADIALIDPPYRFDSWAEVLDLVPSDFVVAESDRPIPAPEGWAAERSRRYGRTFITWLVRVASPECR